MPKIKFYLGVDGGATKTEAVLIDENKKIIGRGSAGGSNATIFGLKESLNQISIAIKQAILGQKLASLTSCLALAGVNIDGNNQHWQQAIKNHPNLSKLLTDSRIVNDTVAALRAGTTARNAIVIIAGTGSNCYGRNENGQEARSGGTDYLLGDEGSGYDIGLKILRSITQALDDRGPKTQLTNLLFNKFKINSLKSLESLVYTKPWNKTAVAQIAPLTDMAAQKGDQVAIGILKQAAFDLAIMIKAVVKKLNLENELYTIVTSGGVFTSIVVSQTLKNLILAFTPQAKFSKPKVDSATAAAYLALEGN